MHFIARVSPMLKIDFEVRDVTKAEQNSDSNNRSNS